MCAAGSLLQVIASRISHRHDGEKGKAYTRNAEANESPNEVIAGSLAHGAGKMRLPAPNRIANSIRPIATKRLLSVFCIAFLMREVL